MSTPTDPYSRPDHEDGHDDILDPLPEQREEPVAPEPEPEPEPVEPEYTEPEPFESPDDHHVAERTPEPAPEPETEQPVAPGVAATTADEPAEEPVAEPTEEPAVAPAPFDDSETESTQSWKPDFTERDEEAAEAKATERASERERWEAAFASPDNDATVIKEPSSAEETRVTEPARSPSAATGVAGAGVAATSTTGSYPTRTSVFGRGSADTAGGPYVSTPPEATQPAVAAQPQFGHRYEEPIPEEPRGRAWAHVGVFFATLLLAPLAWYLVADSGVRLTELEGSAWMTGTVDWMVVLELLGALLCLGVLWYLASISSVGAIVIGAILAIGGAIAIFAPAFAQDLLQSSAMQDFAALNDFTGNLGHHLTNDMASGRLTVYGFLLLMTGVVSHSARRRGAERGDIIARRNLLLSRKSDA